MHDLTALVKWSKSVFRGLNNSTVISLDYQPEGTKRLYRAKIRAYINSLNFAFRILQDQNGKREPEFFSTTDFILLPRDNNVSAWLTTRDSSKEFLQQLDNLFTISAAINQL